MGRIRQKGFRSITLSPVMQSAISTPSLAYLYNYSLLDKKFIKQGGESQDAVCFSIQFQKKTYICPFASHRKWICVLLRSLGTSKFYLIGFCLHLLSLFILIWNEENNSNSLKKKKIDYCHANWDTDFLCFFQRHEWNQRILSPLYG